MQSIHMAIDGDDTAPGTAEKPVARLERAVELARTSGFHVIRIHGGVYEQVTLMLDARDNGLAIEAAEGETPVLMGGYVATGWHSDGDHFLACDIPEVKDGTLDFRSPIVNGRFPERARYPEEGALLHTSVFSSHWMSTAAGGWDVKPTHEQLTTMAYDGDDLGSWLDVKNAEVQIFHSWDDSLMGLSSIDTERKTVTFSKEAGHPPGAFARHDSQNPKQKNYIVWNIREGMTRPGQWYLDRTRGKMVYWPRPGETAETLRVIIPTQQHVIHIASQNDVAVANITVRGLEIMGTTTPLDSAGFGATKMPGMIECVGDVSKITLEQLHLHHPGGTAIKAVPVDKLIPSAISIRDCRIEHCGGCGISLFDVQESSAEDCRVLYTGEIYTSAIALTIRGHSNRIAHNEVAFCPYSAITSGGVANRVEENFIHDFMNVLDDGAAVYCYGLKHGLYRGNVTIGSAIKGRIAHAYYLDELSDGSVVEDNLAIDTCWASHNHMSENCTLRNNLFLDRGDTKITLTRCHHFFFERNVMVAGGTISIHGSADRFTSFFNNLLVSHVGKTINHWYEPENYSGLGEEPMVFDHGNTYEDPGVVVSSDYRVTVTRPELLRERGIVLRMDFSAAGPRNKNIL